MIIVLKKTSHPKMLIILSKISSKVITMRKISQKMTNKIKASYSTSNLNLKTKLKVNYKAKATSKQSIQRQEHQGLT